MGKWIEKYLVDSDVGFSACVVVMCALLVLFLLCTVGRLS